MASSSSKAPCATCDSKGVGIFKCEGCAQVFCRKHVIEHRDTLSHQLDGIVLEHDTLQQTIAENKNEQNYRHPLIQQIDKWERDSIEKIQRRADEARQRVNEVTNSQKETVSKELYELAERLRKAREDDDYVETDLRIWTTKLDKLKRDVTSVPPSINICEDATKVLIGNMHVSLTQHSSKEEERFGDFFGDIRVEDNGRVALYNGSGRSSAYVRGKGEYSRGKHQIRFIINKKTTSFVMSFNIVPKSLPLPRTSSDTIYSAYGWQTDDCINNPESDHKYDKSLKDLRGETTLLLEFLIDCDNRKISYFNERTQNTREMNVNINKCPFPWQLQFYLYGIGDRIQLMGSSQVF